MVRPIDPDLLARLEDHEQIARYAVRVDDNGTVYAWCSGSSPVTINSEVYSPRSLDVGSMSMSKDGGSSIRITVDDAEGELRTVINTGGLVGASVAVYIQAIGPLGETTVAETRFSGTVNVVGSRGAGVLLDCVALAQATRARGLRPCDRQCKYRPGGTWCGLAAAKGVCNGTYAACVGLGNQTRFGGLRMAPIDGEVLLVGPYAGVIRGRQQ